MITDLLCNRVASELALVLGTVTLKVTASGVVWLHPEGGLQTEVRFARLIGADERLCWWLAPDQSWALLVGAQGNAVVGLRTTPASAKVIAELSRPDLVGKYDPGGLQRNQIVVLGADSVIFLHESGAMRVDKELQVRWRHDLGQSELRGAEISAGRLTLETDAETVTLDAEGGSQIGTV